MIKIKKAEYEKILHYAESCLPYEACGLIAGEISGKDKFVKKAYLLTNTAKSERSFFLDPKEQFSAARDIRSMGLILLGCWHSHPNAPAYPSKEDKRLAYDRNISYIILSLKNRAKPQISSFKISGEDFFKEQISII